ncbi:unnamed protein product [Ilex paraguariensis]|uniref:Uncharacterized protein n=1 Tax=Ilex paraguariensis TaxID=185542 RepID=A0ABC8S084_9AQUA
MGLRPSYDTGKRQRGEPSKFPLRAIPHPRTRTVMDSPQIELIGCIPIRSPSKKEDRQRLILMGLFSEILKHQACALIKNCQRRTNVPSDCQARVFCQDAKHEIAQIFCIGAVHPCHFTFWCHLIC